MPKVSLHAITPKGLTTSKEFKKAVTQPVDKTAKLVKRDYESTVRTWSSKNKPTFDVIVAELDGEYTITAGTDSLLYKWADEGTKPHIIRPRKAKFLRFRVGGMAKTTPGVIGSQAGSLGNGWRSADFVLHPGTRKREFSKNIQKRRQKTAEQEISQSVAKLARKQTDGR